MPHADTRIEVKEFFFRNQHQILLLSSELKNRSGGAKPYLKIGVLSLASSPFFHINSGNTTHESTSQQVSGITMEVKVPIKSLKGWHFRKTFILKKLCNCNFEVRGLVKLHEFEA